MDITRAVYTRDFARCVCHPGVCQKFITVYAARYPLIIRCSLSSTLSSVNEHFKMSIARHKIARVDSPSDYLNVLEIHAIFFSRKTVEILII